MIRQRAAVLAAVLLAMVVRAGAEETAEAAVLKREEARLQAMVKVDLAALEDVLADDLTYIHASGDADTKREFIDSIRSGRLKYKQLDREGVAVRVYGDAAVVTGRGHFQVRSGENDLDVRLLFTDVYVRRGGKWRMVAWQSTRLAEK
jgi:ketosteroid isomerase-like protein